MATYNLNGESKTMTSQEEIDYNSLQSNLELEALQKELRALRDAELRKLMYGFSKVQLLMHKNL